MKRLFFILSLGPGFIQLAHGAISVVTEKISGPDVITGKVVTAKPQKGLVVVFLSARCPCSNSHLGELASLSKEHPSYDFIGVHSNVDEDSEETKKYFEKAKLPFRVIQDNGAKMADKLKAYKTPHAFIFDKKSEIIYQGGVSSSHDFESADRKYLREALDDLEKGQAIKVPESRTLGCVIPRGD